jgi:hypothetical protein
VKWARGAPKAGRPNHRESRTRPRPYPEWSSEASREVNPASCHPAEPPDLSPVTADPHDPSPSRMKGNDPAGAGAADSSSTSPRRTHRCIAELGREARDRRRHRRPAVLRPVIQAVLPRRQTRRGDRPGGLSGGRRADLLPERPRSGRSPSASERPRKARPASTSPPPGATMAASGLEPRRQGSRRPTFARNRTSGTDFSLEISLYRNSSIP